MSSCGMLGHKQSSVKLLSAGRRVAREDCTCSLSPGSAGSQARASCCLYCMQTAQLGSESEGGTVEPVRQQPGQDRGGVRGHRAAHAAKHKPIVATRLPSGASCAAAACQGPAQLPCPTTGGQTFTCETALAAWKDCCACIRWAQAGKHTQGAMLQPSLGEGCKSVDGRSAEEHWPACCTQTLSACIPRPSELPLIAAALSPCCDLQTCSCQC